MKMVSICESSARVRSPTPVPASIRMSLSTRNEVVRRCRPPIPPEQPSTRRRMSLLVEDRQAVPADRRRVGALFLYFFQIGPVQAAARVGLPQLHDERLRGVPAPGAVLAQHR